MSRTFIHSCRLISPGRDLPDASVLIDDGRIVDVGQGSRPPGDAEVVDGAGAMLLPGFIDIHTHGANGSDVSDACPEAMRRMAEAKLREGVTTFFPTTLTLPADRLEDIARVVAEHQKAPVRARAPRMHIEGPFINPDCVGAQNPAHVRDPDLDELDRLHALAPVGIVSLAVEMPGGVDFVRGAAGRGITCSLAHTAATHADFLAAKAAGLRHLTHFCNQMTGLHHREIGCVGGGLLDGEVMIELICDGVHLCPDMLRLIWKLVPHDRLMVITDSISASWLEDGTYDLGGLDVVVADKVARLTTGALAGSTARYHEEFRNVLAITGLPPAEVVAATSWNQARSLGLEGVGRLEPGFLADCLLLPEVDGLPQAVWVGGERKV